MFTIKFFFLTICKQENYTDKIQLKPKKYTKQFFMFLNTQQKEKYLENFNDFIIRGWARA